MIMIMIYLLEGPTSEVSVHVFGVCSGGRFVCICSFCVVSVTKVAEAAVVADSSIQDDNKTDSTWFVFLIDVFFIFSQPRFTK